MISYITVNYFCAKEIEVLVNSIKQNIFVEYEIIIVNNNTNDIDILKEKYLNTKNIKIIELDSNYGFAIANNIGAENAKGEILHFVNPDIIFTNESNKIYSKIDNNNSIFVTPLCNEKGILESNGMVIPTIKSYLKKIFRFKKIKKWYLGASVIVDKKTFEKNGKWPNEYFMYSEDLDFFYSAHKNNISIINLDISLIHIGKVSSNKIWNNYQRALKIEKSYKLFFKKHKILYQYFIIRPFQIGYTLIVSPEDFIISMKAFLKTFLFKI